MRTVVSVPDLIWMAASARGILYSVRALRHYRGGERTAHELPYTGRRKALAVSLADNFVASERNRLATHACSLAAGILALFPNPAIGIAVIVLLVGMNLLIGQNSRRALISWEDWRRIIGGRKPEPSPPPGG